MFFNKNMNYQNESEKKISEETQSYIYPEVFL